MRSLATRLGWHGRILGKMDGVLPRVGRYTRREILTGLAALDGIHHRPDVGRHP